MSIPTSFLRSLAGMPVFPASTTCNWIPIKPTKKKKNLGLSSQFTFNSFARLKWKLSSAIWITIKLVNNSVFFSFTKKNISKFGRSITRQMTFQWIGFSRIWAGDQTSRPSKVPVASSLEFLSWEASGNKQLTPQRVLGLARERFPHSVSSHLLQHFLY